MGEKMKESVFVLLFVGFFFFTCIAAAQENGKVVVIPLGKGSNPAVNTSINPWLKLYDNDNTFIGYVFTSNINITIYGIELGTVVNDKNFCASIDHSSGTIQPISLPLWNDPHYLNDSCTGPAYLRDIFFDPSSKDNGFNATICNDMLYAHTGPGGSGPFYIDRNPTTLNPGETYSYYDLASCASESASGIESFYQLIPNDPAVTGFQNNYTLPLRLEGYSFSLTQ